MNRRHGSPGSRALAGLAVVLLFACDSTNEVSSASPAPPQASQPVISFLGEELDPVPLSDEIRVELEDKLASALADFVAAPESVDALIWLGRRLAYLGRHHDSIDTYSQGIQKFPEEPRLYRHRGHRYITTRQLDKAIADFQFAAELVIGTEDRIEPDGMPNERGIPTSTLQSNIWYHLGLAHYLKGEFEEALQAYKECLEVSRNPDMLVATSHWLYMTLRRLDLPEQAERVLEPIDPDLEIIENLEYHQLLLAYRGLIPLADLSFESAEGVKSATLGYGVGNWYLYNSQPDEADEVFRQVLEGEQWAAFGYLAAEAELARAQGPPTV